MLAGITKLRKNTKEAKSMNATIPIDILRALDLKEGDRLMFTLPDGSKQVLVEKIG